MMRNQPEPRRASWKDRTMFSSVLSRRNSSWCRNTNAKPFFSKMFKALSVLSLVVAGVVNAGLVPRPLAYSVAPIADIASIQSSNADSRMFYQKSDGSIWQICVSGHWVNGRTTCDSQIVPRTEALLNTPLTAVASPDLTEWHLFFLSPTNTLSEYIFQQSAISTTNPSGIRGGTSCTDCITPEQFVVLSTRNRALSAMYQIDNDEPKLRVWFVSAGQPNTVMEAGKQGNQVWQLIGMPNAVLT
ncbi:hypothetical protein E1B28_006329 [Marasmius oreades]|uniref:Uncharacterized protein n=1 Tax=Marasmius oreades TaxID=181124 RepID=A0A9P7UWD2_9AGAR|nr:uncharacterized protein E1B28_006329 [Marasmius oreades]KAG7095599.1 hypothetical protein E1B28_006329 [Marasmius oreades]